MMTALATHLIAPETLALAVADDSLPPWTWSIDGWIIVIGALCAAACAIPGCFLVLRRLSLMGDAISHAVLPGIAAAFLLTESRASFPMFIGAAVVGVITALASEWLRARGRIEENSSIGIVFTTLFALGLLLIVRGASHVDLDPGCVLYGAIELTPIDTLELGGMAIPRAAIVLGSVVLINAVIALVFWKELALSAFDPETARSQGINPTLMHVLLMTMTAITAVAAFESVGSILVVALLVVPAAAAKLLTRRLGTMLALALLVGVLSAAFGHLAALRGPSLVSAGLGSANTAGMIAVISGVLLGIAAITARLPRAVRL